MRLRFIGLGMAGCVALSACASASAPTASPALRSATPSAHAVSNSATETDALRLLARAGGGDAPSLDAIEHALGPADVARRDGAGAILTYRAESCALVLVFAADGRNVMRLAEAQPRARRVGDAAPALDMCVSALRAS